SSMASSCPTPTACGPPASTPATSAACSSGPSSGRSSSTGSSTATPLPGTRLMYVFSHGAPHPGNVLVDPETGRIVFLDFGLVGELRTEQRISLLQLLYALKSADSTAIAEALIGLGSPGSGYDERHFRSDVDRLTRQHL